MAFGVFIKKERYVQKRVVIPGSSVIIYLCFNSLRCDMNKIICTTASFYFTGSWNHFMVSGYFAWEKVDR